jgi:ADP-heptose:LPS heptosyltransferase
MNEYELLARSALATVWVNALGRRSRRFRSPRGIIVVKLDHLGDVILATPALRALRDAHSGVPIEAIVRPGSEALLEGSPLVDRIHLYDAPRYRRPAGGVAPTPAEVRLAEADAKGARASLLRSLAGRPHDWIVEFRGDEWTAGELLRVLRPARRFDRGTVRLRDWLSRRAGRLRGRRTPPPLHEVESNLALLEGAIPRWPDAPRVEAPPWPHAALELERLARESAPGFDLAKPYVVVQLGATWTPRAWRPEAFGAVAAALRAAYDAHVVVVGTAEDAPLRGRFTAGGGPSDASFFWGTLSISALGALLRRARLFVGSDGGVAHLAAACGAPSIVLFGPQNPARFRPWGSGVRVLHHPVECYPCAQGVCVRAANPCVNLVTVEEVLDAAKALAPPETSRTERDPARP